MEYLDGGEPVYYLDTHQKPESEDGKLTIIDILVQTESGKQIHIELPKLENAKKHNQLYHWLKFITAGDEEKKTMSQTSPIFREAYDEVVRLSNDDKARRYYEYQKKREADIQGQKDFAIKRGILEEHKKWESIVLEQSTKIRGQNAKIAALEAQLAKQNKSE